MAEHPRTFGLLGTQTATDGFTLAASDGRSIEVTEWHPGQVPVGTILFSHGAGSAPDMYPGIIYGRAASGWRVLAPMHIDSRKHPHTAAYPGLASWRKRIEDMRAMSHWRHTLDRRGAKLWRACDADAGGADAIRPGVEVPLSDDKVSAVVGLLAVHYRQDPRPRGACLGLCPAAAKAAEQYGGKYLVRGPIRQQLESEDRTGQSAIVMEFPDKKAALAFYNSAEYAVEYAAAKKMREGIADISISLIESVPAPSGS